MLTNCFVHTIDKYSPLITKKHKSKQDWFNEDIRKSIQKRNRLWNIYLKVPRAHRRKMYIEQRNYTKSLIKQSKNGFTLNKWKLTSRKESFFSNWVKSISGNEAQKNQCQVEADQLNELLLSIRKNLAIERNNVPVIISPSKSISQSVFVKERSEHQSSLRCNKSVNS